MLETPMPRTSMITASKNQVGPIIAIYSYVVKMVGQVVVSNK